MGKPTFLETSLGYNLYISYPPEGHGGFISRIAIEPLAHIEDRARDAFATQQALQFIKDDPGDALQRVFRKMAFFFGLEDREMIYFYGNGFQRHVMICQCKVFKTCPMSSGCVHSQMTIN
jgi:hypothetical protein